MNEDENEIDQSDTQHKSSYRGENSQYRVLKSDSLSNFSDTNGEQKVRGTLTNDDSLLVSDQELGSAVQDPQVLNILTAEAILSIGDFQHRSFQSFAKFINERLPNSDDIANDEANSIGDTKTNATVVSAGPNALAFIKESQHLIRGDSDDIRNRPEEEFTQPLPQSSSDNSGNRLVDNAVAQSFCTYTSDGPRSVTLKSTDKVMGLNIRLGIIKSFRDAVRENQ